jgi:mono/diheme cytochrome c family protein
MRTVTKLSIAAAAVAASIGAGWFMLLPDFFSARREPSQLEARSIRWLRHLAVPRPIRDLQNPVALGAETLAAGRDHFADHCAMCHGNDGHGRTEMGPHFYPPIPDMTADETQSLSDGELFYAIKNGVRFTGMPAWGSDGAEDDEASWILVRFIRHLPKISGKELEEMRKLNPKSPEEMDEEHNDDRFLEGGKATEPHRHSH